MRLLPFVFTTSLAIHASAQSTTTLLGASSAALSNASVALPDDWALFNNVGSLARVKNLSAAATQEIQPALAGARRLGAVFNIPFKPGTAAAGAFRFGDDLYNESMLIIGYGNRLGIASLGASVGYVQYHAEGLGPMRMFTFNFGGFADITENFSVAAAASNINQPALSRQDNDRLAARLRAGARFKPATVLNLYTELEKDIDYAPVVKCAAEYILKKKIFIRTGVRINPASGSAGIGYIAFRTNMDYAMQYLLPLGAIHQVSVIHRFKHKPTP